MRMHHRHYIRPRFQNTGVNETLEIERTLFVAHRLTVHAEFDDVVARYQFRRERTREEEMIGLVGMADADMAIGIHHVFARENAIGDHEVVHDRVDFIHGSWISVIRMPARYARKSLRTDLRSASSWR